ncbi:hypothetical protein [Myxosarcina sp. GI1]|uniref:glycosyltransferase family 39 protein n=1 Tax=Myxosarcina sp. GI1 TaxID=1541065 RepID=UPI000AE1142B|nr:hypothetical protein [Myxosarcina sp. GI1]
MPVRDIIDNCCGAIERSPDLVNKFLLHTILLLTWLLLGAVLRVTNLEAKPPWSDEWATLVFSLGHSFRTVPLDRVISLNTLLAPLQLDPTTNVRDVVNNLLTESTHPPVYFVLTHWWLKLFSSDTGLVSIWWGRLLSAIFGVLAIPAMFGWGWLLSRSLICAQLAAALMAVSPFGVYLSQEARHYTLAILLAIASLSFLLVAIRNIKQKRSIAIALVLTWIVVNSLGVATHYFFGLTLVAEIIVLASVWFNSIRVDSKAILAKYWQRIYWAIAGTISGCSIWVWVSLWRSIPGDDLTSWVFDGNPLAEFYQPLLRLLIWLITMVFLLPIEGVPESIAIISGVILLSFIVWSLPDWLRGIRANNSPQMRLGITVLTRFLLSAIALILAATYVFGADLTLSARFQFGYFPAVLLLLAISLSYLWQESKYKYFFNKNRVLVVLTLVLATLGSTTIITNFAFQKVERPDLVAPVIFEAHQQVSYDTPVLIATLHQTHGQTGEMMSIGWQFQKLLDREQIDWQPQFLLAHRETANAALERAIVAMPRPFQLWLVNFSEAREIAARKCIDRDEQYRATGYRYQLYQCNSSVNIKH